MTPRSEQLECEAEEARAELARTLDAMRDRLTPDQIAKEALDYARETRVGQFARNLSRVPLIVTFGGIAGACMAAALRSERKIAPGERVSATTPTHKPSSSQADLFVQHEGWGVERVREPAG
jgi:Protein of unknown function (DUF3618)